METDTIVTTVFEGRQIENNLAQKLKDVFARQVARVKLVNNKPKNNSGSIFERIQQAKGVFDRDSIQALLLPYSKYFEKSSELSVSFREKGNGLYKQKNLEGALRAYTLALAFAPTHNLNEQLLLAYTNRSAVLLQMNNPTEAVSDIQKALDILSNDNGRPYQKIPNLKEKLLERKAKCDQAITTNLNRASKRAVEVNNGEQDIPSGILKLFKVETPSKSIPNAESFVQVKFSEDRGRYLVVTKEVAAGSVILVDQPYVSVLDKMLSWETEHCHNCSKGIVNGISCLECSFALFCSEECRNIACASARGGIHHLEHKLLPIFHCLDPTHADIQSLRVIAVTPKKELKEVSKVIKNSSSSKEGKLAGFDKNNVYNVNSYLPMFHLISHPPPAHNGEVGSEAVLNAMKALFLAQLLKLYTDYFKGESENFEDLIACLILKHLESIKYNAISLSKLVAPAGDTNNKNVAAAPYAAAIYPLISLCNHSCDPNCAPVKLSKHLVTSLVSLKRLKQGDELFITYKPLYTHMKTSERQKFLAEGYKFICSCSACEMKWGPGMMNQENNDDNNHSQGAMLILQPTSCEKCQPPASSSGKVAGDIDKKLKQCHECTLKDLCRAQNIREMEKILFECHDSLMGDKKKDNNNGCMECLKRLPQVIDFFGREGFQSYFPLYNVALDLFKRALVQGVSKL